jgi:hypothetical protein
MLEVVAGEVLKGIDGGMLGIVDGGILEVAGGGASGFCREFTCAVSKAS